MTAVDTVTIAGIRFNFEVARTLAFADADNDEAVTADLARVRAGDSAGLLEYCLDGADGEAQRAGWRDYVSTLCAEVAS